MIDYIDEDETVIEVTLKPDNRGFDVKTLSYCTQDIEDKLK